MVNALPIELLFAEWLCSVFCVSPPAHPQPQNPVSPTFEVASIKRVDSGWLQISRQRSGGRISWHANVFQMILYAYHLPSWRVTGLPPSDAIFQVEATTDAAAANDQIRLMFQ
jgi:hypothetical protein